MSVNDKKLIEELNRKIKNISEDELRKAMKRVDLKMKNGMNIEYVKLSVKQDSEKILDENNDK